MKSVIFGLFLIQISCIDKASAVGNSTCGIDTSPVSAVYEGVAQLDTYPWLGFLYYTTDKKRLTTPVVLVTKQMVVAGASEIDRLPKHDFRAVTRVVLGNRCGENEIRIRDYTYHPEYGTHTYSALAMVQLEVTQELRPICPPPAHFSKPQFYAMTIINSCKNARIKIHKMQYVNINRCMDFYRRSGLDDASFWPSHAACARATSGGRCLWHGGAVLAVKEDGRWRMLGFSISGPGCGAPSRFLDYGRYHQWVRRTASSVGHPTISRLADNHLVMRRTSSNVQRFGACDPEEVKVELYRDNVTILYEPGNFHGKYNVTLIDGTDYSCIIFHARTLEEKDYRALELGLPESYELRDVLSTVPKIHLRRWCATPTAMCSGFQHVDIQFYVNISFRVSVQFSVLAYGQEARIISPRSAMKFVNKGRKKPRIYYWIDTIKMLYVWKDLRKHKWFYKEDL